MDRILGYLTRLETQYGLVSKKQPFGEKTSNKSCHYRIDDCFFRFWFRFVFAYSDMIDLKRMEMLRDIVGRDFGTFAGYSLERYFLWKFVEEGRYGKVAGWWDRRGENEIDLVCEDPATGLLDFYEVKTDARRIDLKALTKKVDVFLLKNPSWQGKVGRITGLSIADM